MWETPPPPKNHRQYHGFLQMGGVRVHVHVRILVPSGFRLSCLSTFCANITAGGWGGGVVWGGGTGRDIHISPALILESSPQMFCAGRYYSNSPASLPRLSCCCSAPHPTPSPHPAPALRCLCPIFPYLFQLQMVCWMGLIFSLHYHLL